jgi:hypothetical protein
MRTTTRSLPVSNDQLTGTLEQHLREGLAQTRPEEIAIATAYLTPDGFLALKDGMAGAERVRLLLGERPFLSRRGPADRLGQPSDDDDLAGPGEAIDWHSFLEGGYPWLLLTHAERKALLASGQADPDSVAPFDLNAWTKVRALVEFLERDGVAVRRYLGDRAGKIPAGRVLSHKTASKVRLHAKAYLLRGADAAYAAVGSSNLTKGGLTENIELNLAVSDEPLVRELEAWFDGKWEQGQDCREEFISLLEACVLFGRRFTPWQVFVKALDAAYGRFLDYSLTEDLAAKLAGFQQEAVSRCVALLDRHWGAMLCDSVGLGKTYEGLGILAEFGRRRTEAENKSARALIVCPAQLQENWSAEKLESYGIRGDVATMESLADLLPDPDEEETPHARSVRLRKLRAYQNADIVLVDESHNFRNPATKRYAALLEIIRGGPKPDKRVVLLTATPINNSPWDLYHQLSLITRGDDAWYAGRGPIANLRNTFRQIEKGGGGTGLLDAMLLSLVRRTRHDIRALQEAGQPAELGGQPLRFPHHEIPKAIAYSLSETYGGIYKEILTTIGQLHFAVYNLEAYGVVTEATGTESKVQQRNKTFIGIMRTIFLKRMESSVVALTHTVRSMVDYLDLFLKELDERARVITPKDAQRLRVALGGSLPDDALDSETHERRLRGEGGKPLAAPADPQQRALLRAHVEEDRTWLAMLLGQLETRQAAWHAAEDPKLAALRAVLEGLPPTDAQGVPTKAVIFTNYKDTADYLFRSLGGGPETGAGAPHRWRSNLKDGRWLAKLTGADNRQRRAEVLSYFAPLAASREAEAPDDPALLEKIAPYRAQGIDLLIATDVLSEGQNLQDAQYLINYDLHWNPVRMIQRAGRIDRLFSPHERVSIANVMPEKELESLLNLVKRLSEKVASIEEMVGLDASVLGEQIENKTFDKLMKLAAGGAAAEEVYREGERAQGLDEAFAELNSYVQLVKEIGTEEIKDVPDGVFSVRLGKQAGVFIMLRMPEEASGQVYWRFYPIDAREPLTMPSEVIKRIEAGRDEERIDLGESVNPFGYLQRPLRTAVDQLGEEYTRQLAEQTQDDFSRRLAHLLNRDDFMEAEPELWERLSAWSQSPPPASALNRSKVAESVRLVRQTKLDAPLDVVAERLASLMEGLAAEGLDRPIERPPSRQPSVRDLELVCWELVLTPAMLTAGALPDPALWGTPPNSTLRLL